MNYIGKTATIAAVLYHKIGRLRANDPDLDALDRRWLFEGPPGVAKTTLAKHLGLDLAGHPTNFEFHMGTSVNIDIVREWQRAAQYRSIIPGFSVRCIDEIEHVPAAALVDLRGYLDALPAHVVFIGTTNKTIDELPKPLQTRFQVWSFDTVQTSAILDLLTARFPALQPEALKAIAIKAAGNVRQAIVDAKQTFDVLKFRQAA